MEALNLAKDQQQTQDTLLKHSPPVSSPHYARTPSPPPLSRIPNPTLQAALVALQAGQLSLSQVLFRILENIESLKSLCIASFYMNGLLAII